MQYMNRCDGTYKAIKILSELQARPKYRDGLQSIPTINLFCIRLKSMQYMNRSDGTNKSFSLKNIYAIKALQYAIHINYILQYFKIL
jgi:hypothetical protein